MTSSPRLRREDLAAFVLAPIVIAALAFAWVFRDHIRPSTTTAKGPRLDAPIPQDTSVLSATLRNGVRYYVQENSSPDKRAELRLVVNAGSVLESPDQYGLAHAVEHMLFRGTKRFRVRAVEQYLQSIGMRSGSDINASTSEDETIVRITVPTNRPGAIDTAIAILADMAHDASFDTVEARNESGIVMAEWRSRSTVNQRIRDARNALLFEGSAYATHPIIGDTAVLRKFDVGAMRRFYKDWYRPDLMAVVAVGDFGRLDVVSRIRKEFSAIPAASSPRARNEFPISRASSARATGVADPEASESSIMLLYPTVPKRRRTLADVREAMIGTLWRRVLNQRLEDASDLPGAPILGVGASLISLTRSLDAESITAFAADARESASVGSIIAEVTRLARFGITEDELKTVSGAVLRDRRRGTELADRSTDLADGLVDEFLAGSPPIDRDLAYQLACELLPTITPADIQARARRVALDSGGVIIVAHAPRAGAVAGGEELLRVARATATVPLEPRFDSSTSIVLLPALPTPGKIAAERTVTEAHAFDWTLENGMRVILKPTRFAYDQIRFQVIGPGGASLASDADYPSAYSSDDVVATTGVGPINGTRLERRLDNASMTFSLTTRDDAVSIAGRAPPNDLEMLFQLLYLHFTSPRADTAAFRRYQERTGGFAKGRSADPDAVFSDSLALLVTGHHSRALQHGPKFVSEVRLGPALDFWKARMAHTAGFTVVLTGDFALDRIRPLVAKYLASIPSGPAEQPRDMGVRFPGGITRRRLVAGVGPRARTEIMLSGPYTPSVDDGDALGAVRDLVELALNESLRERLGETYGVDVTTSVSLVPPAHYKLMVDFESSPERADSLTRVAMQELQRLRTSGPTDGEFQKVKAARVRDLDGDAESNAYWTSELSWHARMGLSLGTIGQHQTEAELLSKRSVKDACSLILRTDDVVQLTMVPRPAGGAGARSSAFDP